MSPNETITFNIGGPKLRRETLEGKEYLVVPMAMLTEGVHAGSNGPLYYPKEELAKTPVVWNHKPLVVYHPERNGVGVSACEPEVLETRKVGLVMNAKFDDKLRAEAWIDEAKLKKVDNRVLNAINKGQMVEVSTGLFTDNEQVTGEWNGEKYGAVARNYRPDHLAILPDKTGACSIADGAGLLQLNEAAELSEEDEELLLTYNRDWPQAKRDKLASSDFAGPNETFPIKTQEDVKAAASLAHHAKDPEAVKRRIKSIAKRKGLKVPKAWDKEDVTTNASGFSHSQIRQAIHTALKPGGVKTAHGVTGGDHFVHDVYEDFFISSKYDGAGNQKYYATSYEVEPQSGVNTGKVSDKKSNPKVKLTGSPKEIQKVTSWHDMQGNLIANSQPEEPTVPEWELKQRFIDELRVYGYNTRAEQIMLNRMSADALAAMVQNMHFQAKQAIANDGAGAGGGAAAPAAGSASAGDKMMAQRKARTPKKKRKPAGSAGISAY